MCTIQLAASGTCTVHMDHCEIALHQAKNLLGISSSLHHTLLCGWFYFIAHQSLFFWSWFGGNLMCVMFVGVE